MRELGLGKGWGTGAGRDRGRQNWLPVGRCALRSLTRPAVEDLGSCEIPFMSPVNCDSLLTAALRPVPALGSVTTGFRLFVNPTPTPCLPRELSGHCRLEPLGDCP